MPPYTLVASDNSAARNYVGARRNFTSPSRRIARIPIQPEISPRRTQTLSSRRAIPPDANDLSSLCIRTIRYEDTIEEARTNDSSWISSSNKLVYGSRDDWFGTKGEVRSELVFSHIPESLDTALLLPLDDKAPKKDSPTFAAKRQSISESFSSVRRAGKEFVRRGIQGIVPVTPSKKSKQRPSNILRAQEEMRDDIDESATAFRTLERQSTDNLYDATPRSHDIATSMALIEESIATHIAEDSTDTERTFHDAQESFTPIISISTPSLVNATHMTEEVVKNDEEPQPECFTRTSSRPVGSLAQEDYPTRVPSPENIVTRINQRQSAVIILEDMDYAALSSRRASQLSFVSCGILKETNPRDTLDLATMDTGLSIWDDNEPQSVVVVDSFQNISKDSKDSKIVEQVSMLETAEGLEDLFSLVKNYLRQPADDLPATISTPLEVVKVTTKGYQFRSAHKNYFPVWATGINRDGRHQTQEELVDKIMKSE